MKYGTGSVNALPWKRFILYSWSIKVYFIGQLREK